MAYIYLLNNISRIVTLMLALSLHSLSSAAGIEKSPNDTREYRQLQLDNGLKVTLIHDPDTDVAAASMDVAVGAGSDPSDRSGLAHFLEHMLFLGTEKYPDPDAYARFIQQHGGSNNAYTTFANTNYFFEIDTDQLEPALDRFAQFFIAPLFSESLVQREKNAVHSEFTGKQKEDSLRFWSARKAAFNPLHPMTGFTTGNLTTLADREGSNIRDELIAFYNQYYSANIMSLAVVGSEPLDQLEQWAVKKFSAIENRNAQKQLFEMPLYTKDQLAKRVNVQPLTDQRFLILSFPIPKVDQHRFTRPRSYLGNILGHEGSGSLLSELKRQGWVSGLSAGGGTDTRNSRTFDLSIGLTHKGVGHIDDIVHEVFSAIQRIQHSGLPEWLYDENQLIDNLSFRYQEKSAAARLVRSLSVRAQDWPKAMLLSGPYRRTKFDKPGIQQILDHLVPDNLQIVAVAPGLATDSTTEWYNAPYSINDIDPKTLARWSAAEVNPRVTLPEPNRFLPEALDLIADGTGDPLKLIDTPKLQVWHRTDASFGVPRANLKANFHLPVSVTDATSRVLTDIYVEMINEQLNEFSYAANLAGLGASLSTNSRGISLDMGGYADGQEKMLLNVVEAMTNLQPDTDVFDRVKRTKREEIQNSTQDAPYTQTGSRAYKLLYIPYFTDAEHLEALDTISVADVTAFADTLFNSLKVVVLSHGNLTATQTLERVAILQKLTNPAKAAAVDRIHMIQLPERQEYVDEMQLDHSDSALTLYLQSLERDRPSRARYALLRQLLSQPLFAELRTRQQLGYFVFTYSIDLIQVPSVVITLQSPAVGPGKLYEAVDRFLVDFENRLLNMTDEEFNKNVQSVVSSVEEQDTRLRQRTGRYWSAIVREDYRFDGSELFAAELKKITKTDMLALYKRLFIDKENGRLVVYSTGANANEEIPLPAMTPVVSIEQFKTDKVLLPPLSLVPDIE